MKILERKNGKTDLTDLSQTDKVVLHNAIEDYSIRTGLRNSYLNSLDARDRLNLTTESAVLDFWESVGFVLDAPISFEVPSKSSEEDSKTSSDSTSSEEEEDEDYEDDLTM